MALTAREWLLLPRDEQEARKNELSPEECFKLRMELSEIHFTEEEKEQMKEEEKYSFIHPRKLSDEERRQNSQASFKFLQDHGMLPKEITWEEWRDRGYPLNCAEQTK